MCFCLCANNVQSCITNLESFLTMKSRSLILCSLSNNSATYVISTKNPSCLRSLFIQLLSVEPDVYAAPPSRRTALDPSPACVFEPPACLGTTAQCRMASKLDGGEEAYEERRGEERRERKDTWCTDARVHINLVNCIVATSLDKISITLAISYVDGTVEGSLLYLVWVPSSITSKRCRLTTWPRFLAGYKYLHCSLSLNFVCMLKSPTLLFIFINRISKEIACWFLKRNILYIMIFTDPMT